MTTHELEPTARPKPGLVSVDGRTYPLRAAKLTANAENGIAFSRLTQLFANPHAEPLEVVYTMPLPVDGAVIGYTIRMGERMITGAIQPREKASADYRRALAEGRTAGLLEQDRDDVFQQRLGNLPPGVDAEVEIQVLHPLAFVRDPGADAAQWEFRFPTVVGVRYEGAPGRVADAERLDVDRDGDGGIPARLALKLIVEDSTAAKIGSPTHAILTHWESGSQHVELAGRERLDRDLVVRWNACTRECGARLAIGGGVEGDDGRYGLVTVTPPEVRGPAFSRDLTVLLDASGSMTGEPLVHAKAVVKELLENLEPGNRFELLAFANEVDRLGGPMRFATEDAVASALRHLAKVEARGGTEMVRALAEALQPLRKDSQRQVVMVTDGQVGFEAEVAAALMKRLPANARAHCVGVGSAPNRTVTGGIARAGRGVEVLVGHAAGVGAAARRLCAATAAPILTEVSLGGSAVREVATSRIRDVFAGQPLLALVELAPEGGVLEVRGRLAGQADPWVERVDVPALGEGGSNPAPLPLGALFGREKIADLELSLVDGGVEEATDLEIEAVAMQHRITSRRTSLVAIAEEPSPEPNGKRITERLAVEMPAGVSAEGSGLLAGFGDATLMFALKHTIATASHGAPTLLARFDIRDAGSALKPHVPPDTRTPEARTLALLRQAASASDVAARLIRWRAGADRATGLVLAEVRDALEPYLEAIRRLRQQVDELMGVLPARGPGSERRPPLDSSVQELHARCEEMISIAEGAVRFATGQQANVASDEEHRTEMDRRLRDVTTRHEAARFVARVEEIALLAGLAAMP